MNEQTCVVRMKTADALMSGHAGPGEEQEVSGPSVRKIDAESCRIDWLASSTFANLKTPVSADGADTDASFLPCLRGWNQNQQRRLQPMPPWNVPENVENNDFSEEECSVLKSTTRCRLTMDALFSFRGRASVDT